MNIGSVVQVGGAVRHNPLPPLTPLIEPSLVDVPGERSNSFRNDQEPSLGGFIGGGQLAWRANGPTIEVLDPLNCTRLAAWTFGAILHNRSAKITCVCGIGVGTVTHAVVGIDLGEDRNPQGMVGVLSLRRSRITRAFHFRHKVTNVCMVTGGDKLVDPSTLSPELRSCQGLLAVATGHAFLFLVDLALDLGANKITSDEVSPASFVEISIPDPHAELKRKEAIGRDYHPILCLSENFSSGGIFQLLGPDDNILFEAPSHTVNIASLLYIPQLASLIVGYSFGSFQIINLSIITIDCASPYEDNLLPVFTFAYQEPENDPRSFVYLWVCRSCPLEKGKRLIDKATCSLYAMNYEKKEWIEGHGLWYQGLQSMSPRFEFDCTGGIGHHSLSLSPSKIFSAMTVIGISSSSITAPLNPDSNYMIVPSDEESDPVPELSLCTFCWEGKFLDQGREVAQHYIAIFDINQWYQAQMPGHLRLSVDNLCPFMSFHIMDKVPKSLNEKLLSAAPKIGSWSRHSSKSHGENDWYPSSLSYDFHLLTSDGLVTYRCPSVQQSAITSLMNQGPGAIVNPQTSYNACLFAGIIPPEVTVNCTGSTIVSEREQLLNIALEYHLLSLIVSCVVEFSEGRFSHVGCSLQLLLDWAWNKIRLIKESYDALCAPLFLASEASILSDAGLVTLHQNLTYLSHLNTIVKTIKDNAGEVTIISEGELEGRVQVVQLLQIHLQAILWFYHAGLLPQCSSDDNLDGKSVPFPAKALRNIYDNRRLEIKKIKPSLNTDDLLLIDCILEESGSLLTEIWSEEGHEDVKKIYPPPSLHSLLNMYLLPGMTTATKHRIIQYLFLDLVSILSDNYLSVVEEFVKFPASVSMSPSINKLTQAFWLIDQKDFEMGLSVLLDPLVNPSDITPMQHQRIIKAFLNQGEEAHALSYIQLRHPPETNLDDIQINLTVLLANGRIREAFHYQRKRRVASNAKELLHYLFTGCEKLGRLESIVHLPLSPMEEEAFVNYLNTSNHPATQDILLIYYLQQSRYGEISKLHDGVRDGNNLSYNRQKTRNAIVQGYLSHLPDVRASSVCIQNPKPSRVIYTKPQPLSAHIRQSAHSVSSSTSKATVYLQNIHARDGLRVSTPKTTAPYTPFRSKIQRRRAINDWSEEIGLVTTNTENILRSKRDNSRIVFPTIHEDESSKSISTTNSNVNSSTRLETPNSSKQMNKTLKNISSLREDISKAMVEILRKSLQTSEPIENISIPSSKVSCDVVSLLKTPPVHRRSTSQQQPFMNESLADTPQSILKVRKILQRSQSPEENESPIPSFPLHRSISKTFRDKSSEKSFTASESGMFTPKQLRFDLPSRKLSVDDNNSIVYEIGIRTRQTPQETGIKRKRSQDSSSPNDLPTPRKPLPNFVGEDVNLPYGLNFPETDSEVEEDSTPPHTSTSCTETYTYNPIEDVVVIKTASQSSIVNKNGSINSLEPTLSLNSNNLKDSSPSASSSIDEVCSNSILTSKSTDIAVNTSDVHEHHEKPMEDYPVVNLESTASAGIIKDKSPFIKTAEYVRSPCKVTLKQYDSTEKTLKLKHFNHLNESIHKSLSQSTIEETNLKFPNMETRKEEKEAVKNFLNGILGSEFEGDGFLKTIRNNLTTDKNDTKILEFGSSLNESFKLSKYSALENVKNNSLNSSTIQQGSGESIELPKDGSGENVKNRPTCFITDRNNSKLSCSIEESFDTIDDVNEVMSVESENTPIESRIITEFSNKPTNENKNYVMSSSNSFQLDANLTTEFDKSSESFKFDENDSKEVVEEKVVSEDFVQKQNVSLESIDEVFENAVENFSYTELSRDVSQFLAKNRSISKGDSNAGLEGTYNHCLTFVDETVAKKPSMQLTTGGLVIEDNVNVLDDIDSNYVLTFSDSEEEKELCKVPEPVKDMTNNRISSPSNSVKGDNPNFKCINSSSIFQTQLDEIGKKPVCFTNMQPQDNSILPQAKLIDPIVPGFQYNQSKNNSLPESFLNTSYVPVIDLSAEESKMVTATESRNNISDESFLFTSKLTESKIILSGKKSNIIDANTSCIPVVEFSDEEKEESVVDSDINKDCFSRSSFPPSPTNNLNEVKPTLTNNIESESFLKHDTSCIPEESVLDSDINKDSPSRSSLPSSPTNKLNEVMPTITNKIESEFLKHDTSCIPEESMVDSDIIKDCPSRSALPPSPTSKLKEVMTTLTNKTESESFLKHDTSCTPEESVIDSDINIDCPSRSSLPASTLNKLNEIMTALTNKTENESFLKHGTSYIPGESVVDSNKDCLSRSSLPPSPSNKLKEVTTTLTNKTESESFLNDTSCIPEESVVDSDINKDCSNRYSLPPSELITNEFNDVISAVSNKTESEIFKKHDTSCIPDVLFSNNESEKSILGAFSCIEHKQEPENNESSISHFKLMELPQQNFNTMRNSSIASPKCITQMSSGNHVGEKHASPDKIINDGYYSDDSDKTVEFNGTLNYTSSARESFLLLPTVPEVSDETETTLDNIDEPVIDNNNISKINSCKVEDTLTPTRKNKNLKGVNNVVEEKISLSTPTTPLRRSRRLSASTPSKTCETPIRRQRQYSETNESDSSEVFLPLEAETEDGSKSSSKTGSKGEEFSESGNKTSASTLCLEPITPLKEIEKDDHLPSTPLSSSRTLRERKSVTPQRGDTPIRRSSRLSRSMDNLKTIMEENKVLPQPSPKKTPLRSKRKSLAPNAEPLLETICEDSEFNNLQVANGEKSPSKPSPFEAASTTTPIINRAFDLHAESKSKSVKKNQRLSVGRKKKSASVSPELLSKIKKESGFSISRRTRRCSESSNVSLTSLPETVSHQTADCGESKENEYSKSRLDVDQDEFATVGPISEEAFPLSKLNLVKNMNNLSRKSLASKNASRTFNLPVDTDLSFESPTKSRKPYRRRTTALSSSVVLIRNQQADSIEGNTKTAIEPSINRPTQELDNLNENNSKNEENSSPAVAYNFLEAPEGLTKNLGTLRTSSSATKGQKRKQSYKRGVYSLSLAIDREFPDDIEDDAVPPKRQRKSSTSKAKTKTSAASKQDSIKPQIEEGPAVVETNVEDVLEKDSSTTSTRSKRGVRKTNRKR